MNPLNAALRFILEMAAIVSFGIWGYRLAEEIPGILLAILLPVGFAVLWGVFAVRNDPSRSGKTVINVPGWFRLILELGLFAAATWMFLDLDYPVAGYILGVLVVFHYILSWKRLVWLLGQK